MWTWITHLATVPRNLSAPCKQQPSLQDWGFFHRSIMLTAAFESIGLKMNVAKTEFMIMAGGSVMQKCITRWMAVIGKCGQEINRNSFPLISTFDSGIWMIPSLWQKRASSRSVSTVVFSHPTLTPNRTGTHSIVRNFQKRRGTIVKQSGRMQQRRWCLQSRNRLSNGCRSSNTWEGF